MGHPKKQKKKYRRPLKMHEKRRMGEEREIMKEYGLRRKREIWRSEAVLRNMRKIARKLRAARDEKLERELLERARRLGLIDEKGGIDEILGLSVQDILERRLQTLVFKKGLANSIRAARQAIVHGKITIGDQRVRRPSFLVPKELEKIIQVR
jgi:small subunit ribosomal protein S4